MKTFTSPRYLYAKIITTAHTARKQPKVKAIILKVFSFIVVCVLLETCLSSLQTNSLSGRVYIGRPWAFSELQSTFLMFCMCAFFRISHFFIHFAVQSHLKKLWCSARVVKVIFSIFLGNAVSLFESRKRILIRRSLFTVDAFNSSILLCVKYKAVTFSI